MVTRTNTILDEIVAHKTEEVAAQAAACPLSELKRRLADREPPRGFAAALTRVAAERPAIIAEIKRGSPSLGCLRPDLDAATQAGAYERGGAAAISVLTDHQFFFGGPADLTAVRRQVRLPILRKDFIIGEYQVYDSAVLGADCILLILAILTDAQAADWTVLAHDLGLDVLAEAHNAAELTRLLAHVPADLIGINNRNLKNFTTDEQTTIELAKLVPTRDRLVAESGLRAPAAIRGLWTRGIRRYLVGEAFMREPDAALAVRRFVTLTED